MLHRDHRTFGKHRSCKHPIHIPLVEWHCGKRTCHVNLVICVEGYSSFSTYMYGYVPFSFPFRCILVSLMYFPIFGICKCHQKKK
ncbi:hypothetical protein EV363DRAFT_1411011 [Boletus edulis]|nr:hypothetical protein EV363DRAFT_1411011 [Boletus edulis]